MCEMSENVQMTDGRTNERTDERTNERTDERREAAVGWLSAANS